MAADTVCRVCLVNNLNLYGVRNELQVVYERITSQKYNKVGYPVSMCYICLSGLRKCHRFMETARDADRLLTQWDKQQNEMGMVKPLSTYSITKATSVSVESAHISLKHDVKTENIDFAEQLVVDVKTGIYFCKHCNGLIESFNEAGNHLCFRGKEHIYQDEEDNTILFVHNYENENKEKHEEQVFNNEESEVNNSLLSGYTAYSENDEDLNQSADFKAESNPKKNAVWTKQATMAMLSLYEANIQMLRDIGQKSRVWKKISEGLKDLCIQVTADQVKWKFNRLYNKYKECIDNNNKSGRAHMTFEYYEQFEEIFHKEKNVSTSHTFSSSILTTDEKKRKHEITESKNISKSKKLKKDATSSEKNLPPVDESPKLKTTPVADVKKTARNQKRLQSMEILKKIQENQKARDEKMTKYLKMKEKEVDLKKKAIDIRETEMQVKRDVASEKLKFNEKKHKDWLNIEKLKCELLKKLLKNRTDSEESD